MSTFSNPQRCYQRTDKIVKTEICVPLEQTMKLVFESEP